MKVIDKLTEQTRNSRAGLGAREHNESKQHNAQLYSNAQDGYDTVLTYPMHVWFYCALRTSHMPHHPILHASVIL